MSHRVSNGDGSVPETVVLRFGRSAGVREVTTFMERLEPLLPELNWRTHFFVVGDAGPVSVELLRPVLDALARFLLGNEFVTFYVHPLLSPDSRRRSGAAGWEELLDDLRPFRERAYDLQSEARLVILPIIEPDPGEPDESWIRAADYFRSRLAKPSVLLRGPGALAMAQASAGREVRFYIENDVRSGADGVIRQLWRNQVFEDLLARVKAGGDGASAMDAAATLLSPCRPHLVIDQPTAQVFSCFHEWERGVAIGLLEDTPGLLARIRAPRGPTPCTTCFDRSLSGMTENLMANDSLREGGRIHLELARSFSGRGEYEAAIGHAGRACDLASSDRDRAAALICKGLSHLARREFEPAEAALAEAGALSDDPGLVSYHRGRVQFEWRDYIEALDRFEEALSSGSTAVPRDDLFFYMAVSHINIGEYPEARPYLDLWRDTGSRPSVMLFYRGLCDVGEEKFESALCEFRAAEQAGAAPEDLGRVLFYIGFCLKELGRHAEAIPVLGSAARADPDEIAIVNLLGFCLYKQKRHAEAVRCFERAIQLDPRSAIDYANLASNLRDLGRTEEAIVNYRKALSLDPSIDFARANLAKLLA